MTSQGGGWHIRGDAETVQTGLREINQTRREQAKAERDVKLEEKKTALAAKKSEMAVKKAQIKADKEEKVKNREAQKLENLKKLDNEGHASEQKYLLEKTKVEEESDIAKKAIEAANQETMKKLEKLMEEAFGLEKLKVETHADMFKEAVGTMRKSMDNDHVEAMEVLGIKKLAVTRDGVGTIEFKRTHQNTLSHLDNTSSRTGRALLSSGRTPLALGNDGMLAITDGSSGEESLHFPAPNYTQVIRRPEKPGLHG